ncbi:LANO_0G14444g1_1 [Lachancea nothofagi CBS 11611]|uniref:LANO_0G14444g1_1 n=1 Tax=Lachancea nothofagi CBS 11611 TaxID=1266666 RepID=A0A1G4KKC4_9SACH|nr:LANO_0G14444g1_1 [Lachancea nothofagi CBS 11611]
MNYENQDQRSRSRSPAGRSSTNEHQEVTTGIDLPRRSRYNNGSTGDEVTYERNDKRNDYSRSRRGGPRGFGGRSGRGEFRGGRGGYDDSFPRRDMRRVSRFNAAQDSSLSNDSEVAYHDKLNRNYANSIFVGNITYDCEPADLKELFSGIGQVVRSDIITSRGHHRGMGTVEFTNSEDVIEAIRQFDGYSFMGRDIFVREDNPPPESGRREEQPVTKQSLVDRFHPGYEVFVANLPFSITWQSLKDLFKECGVPTRADVKLDRNGRSRGFGTVIYESQEEASAALDRFTGFELEGRMLELKKGHGPWDEDPQPTSQHEDEMDFVDSANTEFTDKAAGGGERCNTIYVENLPFATAQSDLFDLFEIIGAVKRAELKVDERGEPAGVAVVEYEETDNAEICISRLDKYSYGGRELSISYVRYY